MHQNSTLFSTVSEYHIQHLSVIQYHCHFAPGCSSIFHPPLFIWLSLAFVVDVPLNCAHNLISSTFCPTNMLTARGVAKLGICFSFSGWSLQSITIYFYSRFGSQSNDIPIPNVLLSINHPWWEYNWKLSMSISMGQLTIQFLIDIYWVENILCKACKAYWLARDGKWILFSSVWKFSFDSFSCFFF